MNSERNIIIYVLVLNIGILKIKLFICILSNLKEKIQSNKGSSYKLLVEQAKLKQATSKVSSTPCNAIRFLIMIGKLNNMLLLSTFRIRAYSFIGGGVLWTPCLVNNLQSGF